MQRESHQKTVRLQKDSAVFSLPKTFENSIHCIARKPVLLGENSAYQGDKKPVPLVIDKLSLLI